MMKPILDVTAGNRAIWQTPTKKPPNVVFLDMDKELSIPPDILGVWEYLPFRDDVFSCIIFDPPHIIGTPPPWFNDSGMHKTRLEKGIKSVGMSYKSFKRKNQLISSFHKSQKEFSRVSNRLCFKWNENSLTIWKVKPLFKNWIEIYRLHLKPRMGRRSWLPHSKNTYWVTFIRKSGVWGVV